MSLSKYIPEEINISKLTQSSYPEIAKDRKLVDKIKKKVSMIPTRHRVILGDSRHIKYEENSIHLVVTSPPYWILKEYSPVKGQLALIEDYEEFIEELQLVWKNCYDALVPGGRMVVVVGDVLMSRRKYGRHYMMPLHSSIQEQCREIGFDNLAPIIWYKISNAKLEAKRSGSFLGKPYEPNAIVKNDIEYVLFLRKPGGYRKPTPEMRVLSIIPEDEHRIYFQQIWSDINGTSMKGHPAIFPIKLAERLIRMFSFVGDTVLDPFVGSGTTLFAARELGRNSIGVDVVSEYIENVTIKMKNDLRFTDVEFEDQSGKSGL